MAQARPQQLEGQLTFTIDQAAALLGISRSTAYECARRGELPVLRFGRRLVVTRATLVTLLGIDQPPATPGDERHRPRRTHLMRLADRRPTPQSADSATRHRPRSTA
jgi:excisionase family DNA binding protein